ncbi:hypothetical protein BC941DRAFT_422980 [Chlamydoabsidia padenii]|nr:hypothetical protein BC941DRAFT_422980 [Chlamydoabsidia padenii]
MNQNKQTHSTDLLNIPGKNKTLAKLLADQKLTPSKRVEQDQDTPMIPPPELRKTFKIDPNNDILSRVQSFLPQLEAANQQLQTMDPAKLDIENVEEDGEQYIEMNLGLGVYDTKPQGTDTTDDEDDDTQQEIVIPNGQKDGSKPRIELLNNENK